MSKHTHTHTQWAELQALLRVSQEEALASSLQSISSFH